MYKNQVHLDLLPWLTLASCFDVDSIAQTQKITAAVLTVSSRQGMLCQRAAWVSSRLVASQDAAEREELRAALIETVEEMEKSHNGLFDGCQSMNLPGKPSAAVKALYFEPPVYLDRQVRNFIAEVRAIARARDSEISPDHPHLRYILNAASAELLQGLEALATQYQKESEEEGIAIAIDREIARAETQAALRQVRFLGEELEKATYNQQQAREQLAEAQNMSSLGALIVGVANELNNPLNFICTTLIHAHKYSQDLVDLLRLYQKQYPNPSWVFRRQAQAIEEEMAAEDLPKMLSSLKKSAGRLRQLVVSLRDFSRQEEVNVKPVDINEGLENTLLILQNRLKAENRHPEIVIFKQLSPLPEVECCAAQLNQVFLNLLSNAIDALDEAADSGKWAGNISGCEPPTIRIRTALEQPDCVTVRIADNGAGMSEAVKERLFEPFFTTKPAGKGIGLGLSLGYEIVVEKHGGAIWCTSESGEGSEFWIEIPIRQRRGQSARDVATPLHSKSPPAVAI